MEKREKKQEPSGEKKKEQSGMSPQKSLYLFLLNKELLVFNISLYL